MFIAPRHGHRDYELSTVQRLFQIERQLSATELFGLPIQVGGTGRSYDATDGGLRFNRTSEAP